MDAPYLQLRAISKRFPGVVALSRADLDVRAGEAIALMGANGAGKSTLMNILGGVVGMDEGEILIGGVPVDAALTNRCDPAWHRVCSSGTEFAADDDDRRERLHRRVSAAARPDRLCAMPSVAPREILVRLGSDLDPRRRWLNSASATASWSRSPARCGAIRGY